MRDLQIRQDRRYKNLTAVISGELRKQLLRRQAMRCSSIPQIVADGDANPGRSRGAQAV
jgi:hypothetical protein